MKIGIFADTCVPDINGVVTVLELMTRELSREGHDVYMFYPSHPNGDDTRPGIYHFPSLKFMFYKGMRMAIPYNRSALRRIPSLDIIHSHDPGPMGLLAFRASGRYHIPHVHTYHGLYMDYRRYLPWAIRPTRGMVKSLSRLLCNHCNAIIAPSDQMKHELEGYGITRPIHALPFGVDAEEFSHEIIKCDIRVKLNLHTQDLLLYAGRLGAEKNLDFLLRSFRHLLALRPGVRLIIAGDGPHRQFLERYAMNLGITPYVVFTGFLPRSDLIDFYKQTLFVFTSKTETQGLVLMEAMMAGAAVIAVGAMGPLDIICSGETGVLVEEDEDKFAQACRGLLEDGKARQRIGMAAKRWACSQSSQVSTRKLCEIYCGCIRSASGKMGQFQDKG